MHSENLIRIFSQLILSLNQLHSCLVSLKCIQNWFLMGCSNQVITIVQVVTVSEYKRNEINTSIYYNTSNKLAATEFMIRRF